MKNRPSLQAFLSNLIDYAGLFPPANLPLNTAIENYSNYASSNDSWMLGPFIVPLQKINEMVNYKKLFMDKSTLTLSVVGRKSESDKECILQLKEDLERISHYNKLHSVWSRIETYELPLPANAPSQELLKEVVVATEKFGINVFCEVNLLNQTNWEKYLFDSLDSIAIFNSVNKDKLGIKLRAGGIKAEMIPSTERVALAIAACRDRNLPLKFTAGLHHPVRMYREEVQAKMHGFLNVFLAGMFAYHLDIDEISIERILSDEDPDHFIIADDHLAWENLSITSQEINMLRENSLCSFGSCSFDEPKDELAELSNKLEVIK